jgi:hypothetical protein
MPRSVQALQEAAHFAKRMITIDLNSCIRHLQHDDFTTVTFISVVASCLVSRSIPHLALCILTLLKVDSLLSNVEIVFRV